MNSLKSCVKTNTLEHYRIKSTFSKEYLAEFLESEEVIKLKNKIFKALEDDPLFHRTPLTQILDEIRRITQLRARRVIDLGFITAPEGKTQPLYFQTVLSALVQYDHSVLLKTAISTHFFGAAVRGLGNIEQQRFSTDAYDEKISGCFALTEVAHGTNARQMRTTATYDIDTKEFILHTADFQAAKCWVGNMGQGATHAVVFAQLITPGGQAQGLHAFVTPLRDPLTHLPHPGVVVGDMGEKLGLNGMDNGFCMFNQYRIPRENMLSKFGEVLEDGQYISMISDPHKRFGFSLVTLVGGRVGVLNMSIALLTNAITIAVRYSAVRKQFGPSDDEEISIIEYPLQQWSLFPYLAALFAMKACSKVISTKHFFLIKSLQDPSQVLTQEDMDTLTEMHGLLSAMKPVYSWTTQAAIQQCREACGGHGYLKCAGFGELRNNNDANCTYEGENNVLQQQASNWLVRLWRTRAESRFSSPIGSVAFLCQTRGSKMSARTQAEMCRIPVLLEAYEWLMCWLAEKTDEKLRSLTARGVDTFTARNYSQVYRSRSLAIAYGEYFMISCFWQQCCGADRHSVQAQAVLTQLCALYALSCLDKHLVFFHQGGYLDGFQSNLLQDTVLSLCGQLKDEAVSLVDVVAPPDFILNSVLGHSNGEVYKHLEQAFLTSEGNMERPAWWTEFSGNFRSRL